MSYQSRWCLDGAVVVCQTKNVLTIMTEEVKSVSRLGNMDAILVYEVGLSLMKMLLIKHFSGLNSMFCRWMMALNGILDI